MAINAVRMLGVIPKLCRQCSGLRRLTAVHGESCKTYTVFGRSYSEYTGPPPTEPAIGEFRNPSKVIGAERNMYNSRRTGKSVIPRETDVVIIGGGLIGLSTAFWLKHHNPVGYSVTLIEKDSSYCNSSSALDIGGIRQQFSLPENIEMSMQTTNFLRNLRDYLQILDLEIPDVHFTPQGYLILASENGAKDLDVDNDTQTNMNVKTDLMSPDSLKTKFPWLNVDGISLGSYGLKDEGWFDTRLLLAALKAKAASYGVNFVNGEVVGFASKTNVVQSVSSSSAPHKRSVLSRVHFRSADDQQRIYPLQFAFCFSCAGPWSRDIARLAGVGTGDGALSYDLPIVPRRRYVYVFQCASGPGFGMPMLVDTSGLFVRREGLGGLYVCSVSPTQEIENTVGETTDAMNEYFRCVVQPQLVHRVPCFENITLINSWPSYYAYNYFDEAPVVGNHPYHRNFAMAAGTCGHGAQHALPIGQALMENLLFGEYRTVDLSRFTFDRVLDDIPVSERLQFH